MTKRAKKPKTGNRYTITNMRARQAQTLVRALERIKTVRDADNIPIQVRTKLKEGFQAVIDAIVAGDRMSELPPKLFK